jgi:hypothetical protein
MNASTLTLPRSQDGGEENAEVAFASYLIIFEYMKNQVRSGTKREPCCEKEENKRETRERK